LVLFFTMPDNNNNNNNNNDDKKDGVNWKGIAEQREQQIVQLQQLLQHSEQQRRHSEQQLQQLLQQLQQQSETSLAESGVVLDVQAVPDAIALDGDHATVPNLTTSSRGRPTNDTLTNESSTSTGSTVGGGKGKEDQD
jgi:hypothetical protein